MKTARGEGFVVTFDPKPHKYGMVIESDRYPEQTFFDGEVESVTQAIGILDKPGLPWWGMCKGVEGVLRLMELAEMASPNASHEYWPDTFPVVDEVVPLLTKHKLTVNHQRDKAGTRGTNVHKIAETFTLTGKGPDPDTIPETEAGYVEAFFKFVAEREPEFVRSEVIVGHPIHRYAGTFDFHARVDGELWLGDLKTSKGVYPESMHAQLEAYDAAAVHMGYSPADKKVIVHLKPDGTYDLSESVATFEDFLTYLNAFRAHKGIKERAAAARKAEKKRQALEQAA